MAPMFGALWVKLSKTEKGDLQTGTKMGVGMLFSGIAFAVMVIGVKTINGTIDSGLKMSISYILIAYFLLTVGELFLSPIGLSMFNKLAPAKYASLAVGFWYLTTSLANIISGYLAKLTVKLTFTQVFTSIAIAVTVFGVILILLRDYLTNLMHLDKLKEEAEQMAKEAEATQE